jgi:hypothetical protein
MVAVALLGVAYSAYVGGDAWEGAVALNRFVVTVLPVLVILGLMSFADRIRGWRSAVSVGLLLALAGSILPTRNWPVAVGQWLGVVRPPGYGVHADLVRAVPRLEQEIPPWATVAVAHAGTVPYYLDRRYFDLLGKCDPVVARSEMHRGVMTSNPFLEFFPGHLKWDYEYSLRRLKPDFIISSWGKTLPDAREILDAHYVRVEGFAPVQVYRRKEK